MKDFSKKFISAVMALAMTASMSVYAEAPSSVENSEETAQIEVVEVTDAAVTEEIASVTSNSCIHSSTQIVNETLPINTYHHYVNGNTCIVREITTIYRVRCTYCGAYLTSWSTSSTAHSYCDTHQ